MPTSPDVVRTELGLVTAAASVEFAQLVASTPSDRVVSLLFEAAPAIVSAYTPASAALGLDWYDELRDAAKVPSQFRPLAVTPLREEYLATTVAWATEALRGADTAEDVEREIDAAMELLMPRLEREIAAAMRETVVDNTDRDPDAVGWQRYARPGACKFCTMLVGRGAVFTESTARFAAHRNCHCVAGPSWDPDAPRASVIQYRASQSTRTAAQREALREYLNHNFPDAPG